MKEKIKRFFIEKKELLIFIGVVVFVFAAVIGVATLALNSGNKGNDKPVNQIPEEPTTDDSKTPTPSEDVTPPQVEKFGLPVAGEYELVRTFFDESLSDDELETAVIVSGTSMSTSTGVGYAKKDNAVFEVLAIYSGKVISVTNDELAGSTIVIDHGNNVISNYSSLTDVKVSVGDVVSQGMTIATASTSILDTEAGVHLFLQTKVDGEYVNPVSLIGKQIEEVSESK